MTSWDIRTPSYVFPTLSHMSHLHPWHVITSFIFHWVFSAIISLVIPLSLLNFFNTNDNYIQHSPPLALMETSKHSPPLTRMKKDNLLFPWCSHLDEEFPIFLFFDNWPCQYISSFKKFSYFLLFLLFFLLESGRTPWQSSFPLAKLPQTREI